MGDRAILHVHDGETMGPAIYLHWGGNAVGELLTALRERMAGRTGDVAYASARLVGLAHERTDGNLSLGLWNAPSDEYAKARDEMLRRESPEWMAGRSHFPYSHGDFGVALVDCRDWTVECFGGYGLRRIVNIGGPPTRHAPDGEGWSSLPAETKVSA